MQAAAAARNWSRSTTLPELSSTRAGGPGSLAVGDAGRAERGEPVSLLRVGPLVAVLDPAGQLRHGVLEGRLARPERHVAAGQAQLVSPGGIADELHGRLDGRGRDDVVA